MLHLSGSGAATAPAGTGTVPAIDSTKSFTVSAWVQPDKTLEYGRVLHLLSQGAPGASTVSLALVKDQWQFCVSSVQVQPLVVAASPGSIPASGDCVQSTTTVNLAIGAWVMITGEWDSVNQELRLYVGLSTAQVTGRAAPRRHRGPRTVGAGLRDRCGRGDPLDRQHRRRLGRASDARRRATR